ncbi:MAG: guanylate kinase [Prevotellaceae bacterium]|nr:guanylate kinase [Prevotellaceae bacterium]
MEGKLIIFAAPSGSGKSTIIKYVMQNADLNLHFSISATSRAPRGEEQNGVEYFFLTPDEFRQKIENDEFLEYEEVYTDKFYGTLRSQVDKQLAEGQNVIFDVDVNGAKRIKQAYGKQALSIFVQPPSIEELRNRLTNRATDAPEVIEQRIERAAFELSQAKDFDEIVVNDNLEVAQVEAESLIEDFLNE